MTMTVMFYSGLGLFAALTVLKAGLTLAYWRRHHDARGLEPAEESQFSIIQPILSGDLGLERNLTENVANMAHAHFVWLVDRGDGEGRRVTERILAAVGGRRHRIQVVMVDEIPPRVNPKVFKLNLAMPFLKRYAIVLDDDTVISPGGLRHVYEQLARTECLVTGLPFYRAEGGFLSKCVTGFVNGNSAFTYLPMAFLGPPKTINGMFYAASAATLLRLNAFKAIEDKLCDDYELARLFRCNGIPLIQAAMPCRVSTSIADVPHYVRLMKRWMVFANIFFKENISAGLLLLVILPSFLPLVLLLSAVGLGGWYVAVSLGVHAMKAGGLFVVRRVLLGGKESAMAVVYEMLADYAQVGHYAHALFSPRTIHWRKHRVNIDKNRVSFE